MKILILILVWITITFAQIQDVQIQNIQIGYDENALLVTWDIDSAHVGIADWFNIFYAEAENEHINMLDSALYWFMDYEDCWDWEQFRTFKYSIRIDPQKGWGAYKSTIRIGIMPSTQFFWDDVNKTMIIDSVTYGKLYLAPNILNKRPLEEPGVAINKH